MFALLGALDGESVSICVNECHLECEFPY